MTVSPQLPSKKNTDTMNSDVVPPRSTIPHNYLGHGARGRNRQSYFGSPLSPLSPPQINTVALSQLMRALHLCSKCPSYTSCTWVPPKEVAPACTVLRISHVDLITRTAMTLLIGFRASSGADNEPTPRGAIGTYCTWYWSCFWGSQSTGGGGGGPLRLAVPQQQCSLWG